MAKSKKYFVLLTCEHASNAIPAGYAKYFTKAKRTLQSHRGLDIGALAVFTDLKKIVDASFKAHYSRLLIDLNRSLHHAKLFSEWTQPLSPAEHEQIIKKYYLPYREQIEKTIKAAITKGFCVLHLSIHSFTPKLNGQVRHNDIGLLYDSSRSAEKDWCKRLKQQLISSAPNLLIRYNYPYQGSSDGLTTALRRRFPANRYLGIELELNQNLALKQQLKAISKLLRQALMLS